MEWKDDEETVHHEIICVPELETYMTFSKLIEQNRILEKRDFQTQRYYIYYIYINITIIYIYVYVYINIITIY
jgi:hypothetical protein